MLPNTKTFISLATLACLLAVFPLNAAALPSDSVCIKADLIIQMGEDFHFQPRNNDPSFSHLTFDGFIKKLDYNGFFFTDEDLSALKTYREEAGQGGERTCELVSTASGIYSDRLKALKDLMIEVSNTPMTFTENEEYGRVEGAEPQSEAEWQSYWKSYVKLRVLFSIYLEDDDLEDEPDAQLVKEWKERICRQIVCNLENKIDSYGAIESYVEESFLGALANAFDPHTSYFTTTRMRGFMNALSSEAMSYGIEVERNQDGQIEVANILPGSSAWRSNEINNGDVIIGMETDDESVDDFACLSMSDIIEMMDASSDEKASFTIKKQSGEEVEVDLVKEVVQVQDNIIESFVLEGERKIGYIYLPSFYNSGELGIGQGCALDVSKALIHLKRQRIEGLIFDLRSNGGGDMFEALRVVGAFVNYGAVSVFSDNMANHTTLKDMDRGVIFDKPMVVMVNSFSASASELFAAALQDRNRAIIVGTPSYGKATAQTVLPLMNYRAGDTTLVPGNFLKITMGAFYRVTGESHQSIGVVPDIILPESFDFADYREASNPGVLENTTINKKTYYFPDDPLPIEALREKSDQRRALDATWEFSTNAAELNAMSDTVSIPLNYGAFVAYMNAELTFDEEDLEGQEDVNEERAYSAESLSEMMYYISPGDELTNRAKQNIESDRYVIESYHILNDYLQLNSN